MTIANLVNTFINAHNIFQESHRFSNEDCLLHVPIV